jgi:hypothetical protein
MTKLTLTQQKNIINNAVIKQKIARMQFDGNDTNPQIIKIVRYLDGEIDTLNAVLRMLNGDDVMLRILAGDK